MANAVKKWLKKSPFLVATKRRVFARLSFTPIDIVSAFPAFVPNSAGGYRDRAALTIQTINQLVPLLADLSAISGRRPPQLELVTEFPTSEKAREAVKEIEKVLEQHGSDKVGHGYHYIYGALLSDRETVKSIFEIGLGTNNADVVSTMGPEGTPGASLRAFREFCPNARIYGADIDKRILFSEERIDTFFVDQTDFSTLQRLNALLPTDLDLVIDDGLHSPNANIASLIFGLSAVKVGGWVVIEDIAIEARRLWELVAASLPSEGYRSHLLRAKKTLVFAVERLV